MKAIDRYMARLIFVPLFGALVIASMLLVLDKMLRLFDFVATEGGPVRIVWRMLANMMPEYMSLGIPIGLTLGILMAFRKLALSSELDIFRAVGVGYTRLLRVPYYYAVALAILNLGIVAYLQPYARYYYEELRFDLQSGALGASLKVGEFNKLGEGITLRIDQSDDNGAKLSGIFARIETGSGQTISATAERGQFLRTDDPETMLLRLGNGTLIHDSPKFDSPRILTFTTQDLPIALPALEQFRARGTSGEDNKERTLPELWRIGGDAGKSVQERNAARAAFHYRVVEIAMMLLIPLLAVALAVPPKRSSSALDVIVAIVFLVTYHKINEYGQSVGALGIVDPALVIWGPFVPVAMLILWMYHVAAHVPGGQPIGALDRGAAKLAGWFKAIPKLFARTPKRVVAPAE